MSIRALPPTATVAPTDPEEGKPLTDSNGQIVAYQVGDRLIRAEDYHPTPSRQTTRTIFAHVTETKARMGAMQVERLQQRDLIDFDAQNQFLGIVRGPWARFRYDQETYLPARKSAQQASMDALTGMIAADAEAQRVEIEAQTHLTGQEAYAIADEKAWQREWAHRQEQMRFEGQYGVSALVRQHDLDLINAEGEIKLKKARLKVEAEMNAQLQRQNHQLLLATMDNATQLQATLDDLELRYGGSADAHVVQSMNLMRSVMQQYQQMMSQTDPQAQAQWAQALTPMIDRAMTEGMLLLKRQYRTGGNGKDGRDAV